MNELAKRLIDLLEEKNMSQRDLAEKIDAQEATVSRYINGHRTPQADILAKIAGALNTTTDYLLGRTNIKEKNIIAKETPFTYEYTKEDEELGLPADWIEHLQFIRRASSKLTREEMDAYIAVGRTFAARVEKELKEKEKLNKD